MNEFKGKRVLIMQQRSWGVGIGHEVAKRLAGEGAKLAALTLKRSTNTFTREQKDVTYELILSNDEIMADPQKYLAGDRYELAEICAALGVESVWPLVITLRNHVRTYGEKYFYSYRQNISDEDILLYVMAFYKCIRRFFDEFKPDLIVALNYVALPHIMLNLYGKERGVPMVAFTDCKLKGYYIFTNGYRDDEGAFYDRVRELNDGKAVSPHAALAKKYIEEFRREFKQPDYAISVKNKKTPWQHVKYHLGPYVNSVRFMTQPQPNHLLNFGATIDYRPPHILLRDHYAHAWQTRFAESYEYYPFEKVKKFAYFPLQFQPEANIDVASPFYNNQLDLARQLALALPDDYTLVVREHPAMVGLRPPNFYRKMDRTPNVKLIDYRIPNEQVLKRADIILSINGTSMAEAAFLKKPSIQVGDLGTTQLLPNVLRHTDMTTLAAKVRAMLAQELGGDAYEQKLENFLAAGYDTGFPYEYIANWDTPKEDKNAVWNEYRKEFIRLFAKQKAA